ncbi:protein kinase domain-containing protein [Nocardia sp. NBC_01009]|uniref:serine/threonine-protein kinase n=1 Tax=Nocardia sp. NBC_01009 TaxID=2975996 RepID=UPI0038702DF9|nr:protein kinase [Nocardia sp. NBC_01009]
MGEVWFGHYRLDRLLGSGGTGQVWLAHDSVTQRDVALKLLAAVHAVDAIYRQRFTREARLTAQVRGPHLVPIHTFGELDGRLYIDMEFIEGTNVSGLLRRDGPMSPARAVEIVAQTAAALDLVHRAGLVHRDVKPSNIMVSPSGFVHLIDFGTAHRIDQPTITASTNVVGTLAYMAPERFTGTCDGRADQYSLACVLYECLTGQRPFGTVDSTQQLRAHLMTDPPRVAAVNPTVPAALDAVVARGMSKDPDQRWSSAGEMASDAYAAVTGRETATVEITAARVATQAVLPESWHAAGSQHGLDSVRAAGSMPGVEWSGEAGSPRRVGSLRGVESSGGADSLRGIEPLRTAGSVRAAQPPGDHEPARILGTGLAAAALSTLLAMVGMALWLGRPQGTETDSTAPSSTPTSASPTPRPQAPIGPASAQPPIAFVPAAGQPCNPAVDDNTVGGDGTPLACLPADGHLATWIPAQPHVDTPKPANDKPAMENSGNSHNTPGGDSPLGSDNSDAGSNYDSNADNGSGNSGNAGHGNSKPHAGSGNSGNAGHSNDKPHNGTPGHGKPGK